MILACLSTESGFNFEPWKNSRILGIFYLNINIFTYSKICLNIRIIRVHTNICGDTANKGTSKTHWIILFRDYHSIKKRALHNTFLRQTASIDIRWTTQLKSRNRAPSYTTNLHHSIHSWWSDKSMYMYMYMYMQRTHKSYLHAWPLASFYSSPSIATARSYARCTLPSSSGRLLNALAIVFNWERNCV